MIVIGILIVIIIGMATKIFLMNNDYKEQKNILEQTEKEITLLKEQIKKRCPSQFDFAD